MNVLAQFNIPGDEEIPVVLRFLTLAVSFLLLVAPLFASIVIGFLKRPRRRKDETDGQYWTRAVLKYLSSFGLATIILTIMTIVTLLGTLNQHPAEEGLYVSQKKYFESAFMADVLFGVPIVFAGGFLLMGLLFINMAVGATLKIRRNIKGIGLYISHSGMLLLLIAGLVEFGYKYEGSINLYPGQNTSKFISYHDWQMEIIPIDEEGNAEKALVIPTTEFAHAYPDAPVTLRSEELPFEVVVEQFHRNSRALPANIPIAAQYDAPEINGFILAPMDPYRDEQGHIKNEGNYAGAQVSFVPTDEGEVEQQVILWGHPPAPSRGGGIDVIPFELKIGDQRFAVQMVRTSWYMPFDIHLDDFLVEFYPGGMKPRNYQANVTRTAGDVKEAVEIRMNEPLRRGGYTLFQTSFGPPDKPDDGTPYYTGIAVVNNPSDHWPLIATIITGLGLAIHFVIKLVDHLGRPSRTKDIDLSKS